MTGEGRELRYDKVRGLFEAKAARHAFGATGMALRRL